ncbi:MAG: DUF4129 domain-containing protein [Planctomycetota bacterium]|jgi:hypothetical protein|nr:DUF4129 domain-containing protein [Planctomycetota bacterium]
MPLPDNEIIAATAREVLRDPQYATAARPEQMLFSRYLAQALDAAFNWLRPWLERAQAFSENSPALYYVAVGVCLLLLFGIGADLVYSLYLAARRRRVELSLTASGKTCTAADYLATAQAAAERGDYLTSLRAVFQATLWRLDRGKIQPATTNRQYLRRFARTAAETPLRALVNLLDRKWYGGEPCARADWQTAQAAAEEIAEFIAANHHQEQEIRPRISTN